jgi:hypothetical protein
MTASSGEVMRFRRGAARAIPNIDLPARVSVHRDRIAIMPADPDSGESLRRGGRIIPTSQVEIRTANGNLLKRLRVGGRVSALALSDGFVGMIVSKRGSKRLEIANSSSGRVVASTTLPSGTANELALGGGTAVYRIGSRIHAFDVKRTSRLLAVAAGRKPHGLSVEGRRVAWAENSGLRGRIKAVLLPAGQ